MSTTLNGQWFVIDEAKTETETLTMVPHQNVELLGIGHFRSTLERDDDGEAVIKYGACFRGFGDVTLNLWDRPNGECILTYEFSVDSANQ